MRVIVIAFGRSGSSFMMRALVASGITPYYDKIRELSLLKLNRDDYLVNESFLECSPEDYISPGFLRQVPDNVCLKIGLRGIPHISGDNGQYKVILLERNTVDIRTSFIDSVVNMKFDEQYPKWPDGYNNLMVEGESLLKARNDIDYVKIDFDDLMEHPKRELTKVKDLGVPIDVDKAASMVNPKLHRHKAA